LKGSRRKALPLGALANALAAGEPEAREVIETAMLALVERLAPHWSLWSILR
jgi:hypothetical protein